MWAERIGVVGALSACVASLPEGTAPRVYGAVLPSILAIVIAYEIGVYRLGRAISRWPSDLENARRIVSLLGSNDAKRGFRAAHLGRLSRDAIDRLDAVRDLDYSMRLYNDQSLKNAERYLMERVSEFQRLVAVEMFASDHSDHLVIPPEWRRDAPNGPMMRRYREVQRELSVRAASLCEAIDLFQNALAGVADRIRA